MLDSSRVKQLLPYGVGVLLLGGVGAAFSDFALQWQPVPVSVPFRTGLAYVAAVILLVGGAALFADRTSTRAALGLGCYFAIWAVVLHLPHVIPHIGQIGAWNAIAEITAAACGGFSLWLLAQGGEPRIASATVKRVFGSCLIIFGLAHYAYADFTASMVPGWIPGPLFWAYATGTGHLAAGLSLWSGVLTRLATTALTAMFASFVFLLHVPRVIANPATHMEWVMLGVSITLMGSAWAVRALTGHTRGSMSSAVGHPGVATPG